MGCRGGRWNTTSEQFYYVAWAFYCFAHGKAAVLEDDGLFLFSAAALVMKMLFTPRAQSTKSAERNARVLCTLEPI